MIKFIIQTIIRELIRLGIIVGISEIIKQKQKQNQNNKND